MMSFFGAVGKPEKEIMVHSNGSPAAVSQNGMLAGFSHPNDSNATTIVKKNSRLVLVGASQDESLIPPYGSLRPDTSQQSTRPSSGRVSRKSSRQSIRPSPSTPALHARLQQKLQQTLSNHPTVVVRPGLRSRPSIQASQHEMPEWIQSPVSSSPSTYNSGSGSAPKGANKSTPATSDGYPSTPTSVRHFEGITLVDSEQSLVINQETVASMLSTIPESTTVPSLSVKTVEATASAKIFFETHFNTMFNGFAPREIRWQDLNAGLRQRRASTSQQCEAWQTWYKHESDNLRLSRVLSVPDFGNRAAKSLAVGGFEMVKILGKGSFGVVRLVKERAPTGRKPSMGLINFQSRSSLKASAAEIIAPYRQKRDLLKLKKEVYAMKVIRKSDMLRNGQEGHLRAERDFLVAAERSAWIIPLLAAFQDNKFLYLVMDFCIGGDFLGLLIRKNILSEDVTRWYMAEMILCIEEAHSMRWIHRDVKPDNFLIGADGHLKISDFGLAFDGDWEHDQRFYHDQRYELAEQLGIEIRGDEQDAEEQREAVNSQKVAELFPPTDCPPGRKHVGAEEACDGEPIIDWRNRAQRRRLARSVVGTSQYMAPEVIRGDMYDGRCD
ncbi:uncharacterized protein HMPREF1541_05396 [Cyphellophora europaea CBS 101466]|uniref:non-specific serine/threonine protein kinase n=1 Tax=Cyphellophora europaea (strain CBS 101466) TaxID=1220924 RepID=W2RTT6_CYPE1|nr:uncharacterized protein HMPREF1541_05396 [Cyphellophora europaea CBS 101466]ETN39173.1 hypothetical protein HMPREF1541_05396 [Cyphellophora europaea CBS 101466]